MPDKYLISHYYADIYLVNIQPDVEFSDDIYAKAANLQALKSFIDGGYGIGSVLINQEGKIITKPITVRYRNTGRTCLLR